jgi:hypothetical protein
MKALLKHPWWAITAGVSAAAAGSVHGFQMSDALAFSVGPVTLRPSVGVSETFTDNLFYQGSGPDRVSDIITTASVGMTLALGREIPVNPWMDFFEAENNFVTLGYDLSYLAYVSHSDLNSPNHTLTLKDRWKGNRLAIKGSDTYAMLTGMLGGGNNLKQSAARTIFNDNYTLDYRLSEKTGIYLNGSHYSTDYATGTPLYDIQDLRGTGGFSFKALPKTSFFGEVYYGLQSVGSNLPTMPKGPDLTVMGGFIGANGTFTPHLTGMLKAGYEVRKFSDNSPAPGEPVVEASLTHRYREKTATSLSYSRRGVISVQSAAVTYTSDIFSLGVDQRLGTTGQWSANFKATVEMDGYSSSGYYANRQDQWYRFNVGLTYQIRVWMMANLGYEYEKFSSNTPGIIDYDVNRVTLRLAVGY